MPAHARHSRTARHCLAARGRDYTDSRDIEAGGDLGTEAWTGYVDHGVSANVDYYLNADRTLSATGRTHQLVDPPRRQRYTSGTCVKWIEPAREFVLGAEIGF